MRSDISQEMCDKCL